MIRSLGSSLVAKASPGSKTRETIERRIENPAIPNRGQVGSVDRELIEETKSAPVPEGSEKQVRVSPGVSATESAQQVQRTGASPEAGGLLPGALGLGPIGQQVGPRSGPDGGALARGVDSPQSTGAPISPPSSPVPSGRGPSTVQTPSTQSYSGGEAPNLLEGLVGQSFAVGPQSRVQSVAPRQQDVFVGPYQPNVGNRVSAAEQQVGPREISGNTAQAVAGTLSKAAEKVGGGSLPQIGLRSFAENVGQVQNPFISPAAALNQLNQSAAKVNPIGIAANVVSGLRSQDKINTGGVYDSAYNAASNLRSQASNVFNKLRSLFR